MSYMCPVPVITETNLYYSRQSDIEVWSPQYVQTPDTFKVIALFSVTFHVQRTQNLYCNCFSHWKMNETRWMFPDLCPSSDVTHTIPPSYMNTPENHSLYIRLCQQFIRWTALLMNKLTRDRSSEISPTRCNNCVSILRNGFTLHVSGAIQQEARHRTTRQRLPTTPQQ